MRTINSKRYNRLVELGKRIKNGDTTVAFEINPRDLIPLSALMSMTDMTDMKKSLKRDSNS